MRNGDPYFSQFDIKHYDHWTLRVEEGQRYLGQAVAWLERDGDMQRISSLNQIERYELWSKLLPEYEQAIERLWQPDHMNYAWLGNFIELHNGHGHMHLIPRYKHSREFSGITFEDGRWGKNYVPYAQEKRSLQTALAVRDALRKEIKEALHE